MFARDTSISGLFVQQWKLRMVAQEAALNEVAISKFRSPLAYNKSCDCTDVKIGGAVLFHKTASKQSAPLWRGPAKNPDIAETGVTAKFQLRTF